MEIPPGHPRFPEFHSLMRGEVLDGNSPGTPPKAFRISFFHEGGSVGRKLPGDSAPRFPGFYFSGGKSVGWKLPGDTHGVQNFIFS